VLSVESNSSVLCSICKLELVRTAVTVLCNPARIDMWNFRFCYNFPHFMSLRCFPIHFVAVFDKTVRVCDGGQWRTQEFFRWRGWGYARNFFSGGGRVPTNSGEDRGQSELGSGGGSPLVRGYTQFANE
jgi:hypothetical protein